MLAPHVLREYAFLADGRRGALIGPSGDITFLCVPDWHSSAVFAELVGGRGSYSIRPANDRFVWGGQYEPGSLIWTSHWVTTSGVIECDEALAYPGDARRAVLLRRVRAIDRDAVLEVVLDVRAGFGRTPATAVRRERDGWSGRAGRLRWQWTGVPRARPDGTGRLVARLRVPAGRHHDLTFVIGTGEDPPPVEPAAAWQATRQAWAAAGTGPRHCIAPRDARHAVTVLRGMTHPDGGLVAAATTSLPERAESGRDYDYRYAWIRDQCLTGQACAAAGVSDLLDASVRYVTARLLADGPDLAPAYTVDTGERIPAQHRLARLPGYPGGGPVHTGNNVHGQFQLDMFGEALLLYAAAARHDRLEPDARKAMTIAADTAAARWTEPDAGIWELDDRHWTHSKLICVAGLRAAARHVPAAQAAAWYGLADTILTDTDRHGLHPSGRWQRSRDDPRVDAALLLPAIRGALPTADLRSTATLAAVHAELVQDGYVYRYRADDRPPGEAEGAFQLCGFLAAHATHLTGDPVTAARLFERSRAACGPSGILSEEYDVGERQMRGNLPQAFVHAALLGAAVALAEPRTG
ncbi:glycoside hydrolase family 15 protein [Krasilnikovia sp. MM14-A1259]|uniref:glycoside hydrolase family 15 protein n=1 Tax=Krasilnikovia sp. MM14-A1259 TaxID=3373539 RepID=UPI003822CBB0